MRKSYPRAKEESPLADVRPFPSSKDFPALLGDHVKKIGFTFDVVPVQQLNFYSKLLPGRELIDISAPPPRTALGQVGFRAGAAALAAAASCSVFAAIPGFLNAACARSTSRRRWMPVAQGRQRRLRPHAAPTIRSCSWGWPFRPCAASYGFVDGPVSGRGLSIASPHGASTELVRENEPILVDYSFVRGGYISDMARVFVFGSLDAELQRAFDLSLEIQDAVRKALKPGAVGEELFFMAAAMAEKAGFGKNFMGMPGEQAKFVGHGVGLELDELPVLARDSTRRSRPARR